MEKCGSAGSLNENFELERARKLDKGKIPTASGSWTDGSLRMRRSVLF